MTIDIILEPNPIVPVVTIADPADAVPLASALLAGGISILEVTLRSDSALDAIAAIAGALPEITVGAGTIKSAQHLNAAIASGAKFAVAPGMTESLMDAAAACTIPFLPAAGTASEVMVLLEAGFNVIKFFPAAPLGGIATLAALAGPLPEARFCPSGGVTAANFSEYLAQNNVVSVSGSWLAPSNLVKSKHWHEITGLARTCVSQLQ